MKRLAGYGCLGLVLLLPALNPIRAATAEQPNILFFFVDDQRDDTLGCAGHPILKTPAIDELAAEGVRFENAFVTTPICWISRATVLSGMWSRSHGRPARIDAMTDESADTIYPKLLREAGYRNGFFGKWHARMPEGFNQSQYFDEYENIFRNPYFKEQPDGTLRHETEIIGDRAVGFLQSQPEDQPFCLNLWFNAVHAEDGDKRPGSGHFPWPKAQDGKYENIDIPPPRLNDPEIYNSQPEFLKESLNRVRFFWRWDTPSKYSTNMRAYFRMISGIDTVIRRVVDELEARGLAENTIIVYSADNGYYMGDRGFAGKWSHYDESIRVPMIVYDPRLPKEKRGRVDSRFVLNTDFASTFLDLAGLEPPDRYQGRSLMPLVYDQATDWREDVFAEHLLEAGSRIPKWEGVRGERYMYARYFEHEYEFLHDLREDPDQLVNLIDDAEYQAIAERMRARCDELRDVRGGPYVSKSAPAKPKKPVKKGAELIEGVSGKALRFDGHAFLPAGKLPPLERDTDFTWTFQTRILPGHPHPGVLIGNRTRKDRGDDTFIKFTAHSFQYFRGRQNALRLDYQLPEQQWVHLAAVKRGPAITVYVDGKPVATGEVAVDLPELPFYLGGDPHAGELSKCDLAEVRLYEQALSDEQVRQQAEGPAVPSDGEADDPRSQLWSDVLRNLDRQAD